MAVGKGTVIVDLDCEQSSYTLSEKLLSETERQRLENDSKYLSDFKKKQLEDNARKNWDLFYKRNATNFFKDRHWIEREFKEISALKNKNLERDSPILFEVGCGCGNTIFPIVEENENVFIYACDFSQRAVKFVQENELFRKDKCHAFQADLTKDNLNDYILENSVDIVTMFFVLSAIAPKKMTYAIEGIKKVLKPGGVILFRDYGLYDHAMLRFKLGQKIEDNFYVRQDGTRAYYFSLDFTKALFVSHGFEILENHYALKRTVNKKENIDVARRFIQGRYKKTVE